jgi:hypothetical protein
LRELVPAANRVAVLVNPTGPNAETTVKDVGPAAISIGLDVRIFYASNSREISAAFTTIARERSVARCTARFRPGLPPLMGQKARITAMQTQTAFVPALRAPKCD